MYSFSMTNFEINEVINLFVDIASIPILLMVFHNKEMPRYRIFIASLICIVGSHLFTIIEGIALKDFFNLLEHLFFLFSSIFFLSGVNIYFKEVRRE